MSCLAGHLSAHSLITILMDWDCCCSDSSGCSALTGGCQVEKGDGGPHWNTKITRKREREQNVWRGEWTRLTIFYILLISSKCCKMTKPTTDWSTNKYCLFQSLVLFLFTIELHCCLKLSESHCSMDWQVCPLSQLIY